MLLNKIFEQQLRRGVATESTRSFSQLLFLFFFAILSTICLSTVKYYKYEARNLVTFNGNGEEIVKL